MGSVLQWLQLAVLGVLVSILLWRRSEYQILEALQKTASPRSRAAIPRPPLPEAQFVYPYIEPRSDGVIFVSNAASGAARAAVLKLASSGYHILLGVRSRAERNSFLYDSRKGLELIDFDIVNPTTYPGIVDRLRRIERDLDRPFVGLLVNLADSNIEKKCSPGTFVEIKDLDECYRSTAKSSLRLFHALWELRKIQSMQQMGGLLTAKSDASSNQSQSLLWDAQSMRVVLCVNRYSGDEQPSLFQIMQQATTQMFLNMRSGLAANYSLSIVNAELQNREFEFATSIDWTLFLDDQGGSQNVLVEKGGNAASALIHAFHAKHPLLWY